MDIIKNNISLLSSVFDSYLIDKDSRFLSIAAGLTDSIRKVYGQATPPPVVPSANFDHTEKIRDDCPVSKSYW